MWTIIRLNWPFYAGALVIFTAALLGVLWMESPILKWVCGLSFAGAIYFLLVSLAVSHLVYDRSDLYRWEWLKRALHGAKPDRLIFCHSGFDETSQELRDKLGDAEWVVLDHYNESQMTEASIRRARKMFPPTPGTMACLHDRWPVVTASVNVVFGLLAIHELRTEPARSAWFAEAKRCLKPGGRVLLAEHTRDLANFIAFGPGFLHFHSIESWRRCWEHAGFHTIDEFRVTPWVRIFVIAIL